ncbi:MAG: type II toxin-antitoxin system HicA family toxin [Cytophagales bacterium]|nr:type II toxin-antitoxin system HicA family toxin [Cytophagales bacterium]MCA6368320.1 type II toxin-antitoxin system HicA family toxin [Cytophagales bacterium]MCA6372672.1 type II toxin-antitoxin system HicA family toxin [Cytophagales bacterium]MCA6376253.1 type II toxin-antitoxin system HicA family toxin [Cytophagales bacterium]MCA6385294.1 type II toxin-antitoxin system HicA family toxin [Cytophagales bacterium]
MTKLRVLSGREVCRILASNGFLQVRQKGSHIIMQLKTINSTITVPVPDHKEIRIGTLQSIIRQTGLPKQLFEN